MSILYDLSQFRFRFGDLTQIFTRKFETDAATNGKAIKSDEAAKFFSAPVHGGCGG